MSQGMREKKNKQKLWLMVVAVLIQLSCAFSVLKPKTTNKENGKKYKKTRKMLGHVASISQNQRRADITRANARTNGKNQ